MAGLLHSSTESLRKKPIIDILCEGLGAPEKDVVFFEERQGVIFANRRHSADPGVYLKQSNHLRRPFVFSTPTRAERLYSALAEEEFYHPDSSFWCAPNSEGHHLFGLMPALSVIGFGLPVNAYQELHGTLERHIPASLMHRDVGVPENYGVLYGKSGTRKFYYFDLEILNGEGIRSHQMVRGKFLLDKFP